MTTKNLKSKSLRLINIFMMTIVFSLPSCTIIQRTTHMYGKKAPPPLSFQFKDGGSSIYYSFIIGDVAHPDTAIFFYGGTGCPSWKSVLPDYVSALTINAQILVLNKRFVSDRSTGVFECGQEFHLTNNPDQWVEDYTEFITSQIAITKPKNVVLVGVSEGVWPAIKIASLLPQTTHLAIIGAGGYTMRESFTTLHERGAFWFNLEKGWIGITDNPRSIEKKWLGSSYRWWSDVMDIDPLKDFLKLDIPILLGIGEQDEMVPVESALYLKSEFDKAKKNNLILMVFPGADHRLNANGRSYRKDFFEELSRLILSTKKDIN